MSSSRPDFTRIDVPDWVNYIAQDSDGSWWGYSVEPHQNHRGWYENELGDNIRLLQTIDADQWPHSLFKYHK